MKKPFADLLVTESEYQGKKVKLNDPIRTSENPNKKFKVYVKKNKSSPVDKDYLIDHSSLIFLLDKDDRYIKFFRPNDLKEGLSFN